MKLLVTVAGRDLTVDLPEDASQPPQVDGEPLPADVVSVRPGLFSVIVGGRSFEVVVEPDEQGLLVAVDGAVLRLTAEDERRRRLRTAGALREAEGSSAATVVAPMPGRVVAVPVPVGAAVERGETVIVLEAMKMESSLAAPRSGHVAEVFVRPGQTVQQRQPLVKIEASVLG